MLRNPRATQPVGDEPEQRPQQVICKQINNRSRALVILSLDGGGMRGVVALEMLIALEKEMRSRAGHQSASLVDYVDLVAGTSAGGLLALLFAWKRLSLIDCVKHFDAMVGGVFSVRTPTLGGAVLGASVQQLTHPITKTALYSHEFLETSLKRLLGENDYLRRERMLPATTTSNEV